MGEKNKRDGDRAGNWSMGLASREKMEPETLN